ncbi:hypothetical protein SOVF_083180 isoform A [Spinacia oleracea]|uniref:Nuclear transcription factor Y subunit n=1 Tax=Spinacia oleracea TaxID=3562 RepID=A0A9R0J1Y8_SPIOL|nr:nuclear transcription factor Y subunit A-10-like isoform X2 [Spinacia oleracea]XP_056683572.1 nuclear transcription factor Y subunit A-10-like isoform X2 [Spinacia oleracea]KNA17105.1 hypothetical protein SOVF_083180 isoform A [Spinacia oleracea]
MQKSATNRQISCIGSMPWWVAAGPQDEQINSPNLNQIDWVGEHQKSQHVMSGTPEKEKQGAFQLSFSAEENNNSLKEINGHDHQSNSFKHFSPPQQKSYVELGLGQPMVYANYPIVDHCHGLFAVYGTQPTGRAMLPFSVTTEDGPIYVNPKQYHGILRRRKMRAKEGMKNRSTKDKPYVHESRHRHACRRARGAGGRFLNTKNHENEKSKEETKKISEQLTFPCSHSSGSEVVQSDGGNLNSSKEISDCKSSNFSSSEVTSMYYNKEFDCFGINPGRPFAIHPLQNMEGSRQGGNWVTVVDGCCNLFKV